MIDAEMLQMIPYRPIPISVFRAITYTPRVFALADELVVRILKKKDPAERLRLLRETKHPQAQFLWSIFPPTT